MLKDALYKASSFVQRIIMYKSVKLAIMKLKSLLIYKLFYIHH